MPFPFSLRRDGRFRSVLQLAFAVCLVAYAVRWLISVAFQLSTANIWANDFFALWSFAQFSLDRPTIDIYDHAALHEFQMDLGGSPKEFLPYIYPPSFLFVILPFGLLSYYASYGAWSFITLVGYGTVSLYKRGKLASAVLILLAPATLITLAFGQTGLLTSALIVGGLRVLPERPVLSGMLFGLASVKPQLGILIPIALIATRLWRCLAAAVTTVLALVLTSSLAFGPSIWSVWLSRLFAHADWAAEVKDRFKPTIAASLVSLGVDLGTARALQLGVAVLVGAIVWLCYRRGPTVLAGAALMVGTFLATPYAFVYDLPMVTNAVLAVVQEQARTQTRLAVPEYCILALAIVTPVIMMETWRLSMARSVPLVLLFGVIVRLIFRSQAEPQP